MRPHRRLRFPFIVALATVAIVAASALGCGEERADPVIGFTYNWGESGLVEFLEAEVARRAPPGAPRLRVMAGPTQDWRSLGTTALAAEVNRALALADDPAVVVVVGPGGSREVLQVAPVYRRGGLAHIAPTATSRALAGVGEWTFLMAPNDSLQGEFIGAFADTALGARRVAIFYSPDEYGVGLASGIEASLAARAVQLLDRVPVRQGADCLDERGRESYRLLVAQLALRGAPDVVIAASRSIESACLLRALRLRWRSVRLITGDGGYVDETYFQRAGPSTDDSYFVAFWHPSLGDSVSMAFADGFRRATGRAPRHGDAVFRDAVMLAAAAIWEVGADRQLIRDHLATLGADGESVEGIAGPVAFAGRRGALPLLMTRAAGGQVQVVGRQ